MKNRLKSMEYVFNWDSYSNVRFCCLTYISHEKFRLDKAMEMKKTGFYCSLFINICFILKKNINNDPRKNRLKSKQLLTKLSNLDKWPLPLRRVIFFLFIFVGFFETFVLKIHHGKINDLITTRFVFISNTRLKLAK